MFLLLFPKIKTNCLSVLNVAVLFKENSQAKVKFERLNVCAH